MTTRPISGAGQPSNNPFASASLYVGDLGSDVTEATLFELFNAVGPVASIRVCRDATTRRSLGYAYVNFHSVQDAERALDTMNFTNIRGKQCRIMWSQRDPRLRQSGKGNIFVKNLHESIDNKTLYDTFSVFGNILSCKVVMDKDQAGKSAPKSRGYGYVHYVDDKSAKKAIEGVNGMKISDKEVHAELFKPREERMKNSKFTNVYVKYIPKSFDEDMLRKLFESETNGKVTHLYLWKHDYGVSACLNFDTSEQARIAVEKLNGREIKNIEQQSTSSEDVENKDDEKVDADKETSSDDKEKNDDTDNKEKTSDDTEKIDDDKDKDKDKNKKEDKSKVILQQPVKLYVARAQKRKERKEYLARLQKRRGVGSRRNYTGANLYVKNLSPDVDDKKLNEMFAAFGTITSAKIMREASGKSRGFGFVAFEKKEAATRAIHEMTNTLHHGKPLYVSRAQTKAFRQQFIMKQLRNKRRNNMNQHQGGGGRGGYGGGMGGGYGGGQQGYGGPSRGGYGGPSGGMGGMSAMNQPPQYGGMGMNQPPMGGRGGFPQQTFGGMGGMQPQMGRGGFPMQNPMQYNPMMAAQQAQQQQLAAQIQAQQQAALAARLQQQQQLAGGLSVQQQSQQQNLLSQQQAAQLQAASSINQMSSQQLAAHQRSQSMGQSQPAQSMQSGPQSIPRPMQSGLTSSQQMVPSQPVQSSVPTGQQHSVSQLSAGGAGQTSAPMLEVNPLTSEMLKDAKPAEKKRLIGERLFPKIQVVEPRLAGKITGMLLEMDNTELLVLLSEQRALMNKINEALAVLKDHQQKQSQQNPGSTKNPSSQNPGVGSATN